MPTLEIRSLALAASLLIACGGAEEPPSSSRLVLGAECPAGSSWDGSRCATKKAVVAAAPDVCPDGSAPDRGECPPGRSVEDLPEPDLPRPPLHSARDLRPRVHKPRAASLLKTEIQQLKALLEVTAKTDRDYPLILRRLAEDHAELAWAAPSDAKNARQSAIEYYSMLNSNHRDFCASPPSKRCNDEVLYYRGLEYELLGKLDQARQSYLQLIRDFPQSSFVAYAYFAFGEYFYREAANDPSKLPLAEQVYQKASEFPDSPIASEAVLRLAEIAEAAGDTAKAQKHRKRAAAMIPSTAPAEGPR